MTNEEVLPKVLSILEPFCNTADGITNAKMETTILGDLKVNSARLVDVVLEFEEVFDIEISDEDADNVRTVGDAVNLIVAAKS